MDPTTVQQPPPPPLPPQNPHTPTDALIESSSAAFGRLPNGEPSTSRNMNNFKALLFNLAGKLLPAHQQLVERRFDEILPHELLVPDHPPYADMILTALWELKSESGSSEEDVSNFIKKEYHELPWAHATILNRHLKDLCKKGKITMTHERCYILGSLTPQPELDPGSSPSPMSSSYSSSSTSVYSSPSSSSSCSSLSWVGGSIRRRKRKIVKRRKGKKKVQVRGRGRDRGKGRGRGRGKGRIDVEDQNEATSLEINDKNEVTSLEIEGQIKVTSSQVEDQNEVTSLDIEDQNQVKSLEVEEQNKGTVFEIEDHDKITIIEIEDDDENTSLEVEDHNQVTSLEVKDHNKATALEIEAHNKVTSLEIEDYNKATSLEVEDHNKVTSVEVEGSSFKEGNNLRDVNAAISEEENLPCEVNNKEKIPPQKRYNVTWIGRRVRRLKEDELDIVKEPSDDEVTMLEADVSNAKVVEQMESNQQDETQQCDIVERETLEEEQVTDASVEKQHDDTIEELPLDEPIDPKDQWAEEPLQSCEQNELENVETEADQKETVLSNVQQEPLVEIIETSKKDSLKEKMTSSGSKSEGPRRTRHGLRSGSKTSIKTGEPLQSCKQDEPENVETESTKHEEHQTEANQKQIVLSNILQEPLVETSKKGSLQENTTSSGSTTEKPRRTRQGLRSSSKTRINTEVPLQSCEQDELENVETESTKHEEHQTEANQKHIVLYNIPQEPPVETSKKGSLQENTTSSGSTTEKPRRTRQGLRSSSTTRINTEVPLQSCKQDELENAETESTKHEEHQTEANQKQIVLSNIPQEPLVETSKKGSLQENTTSSGSTTEKPRRTRQGLRSSSKTRINTQEPLQSCKQDELENVETESTKYEEHQTDTNLKEIVLYNVQQGPLVEIVEQETETSKKTQLQENMTSSGSTNDGPRRTRQGLRSSSKKEDAAPSSHSKKQRELVTPVRRNLRSNKTISEPAAVSEVPDNSKQLVTYSGQTRSSKRKPEIAEAEQVSSTRKTRRTGL